jgi:DNA mismatch endonuclease (patch repair protein)
LAHAAGHTKPKNNATFWRKKLAANKSRDLLVSRTLQKAGWRVLRIWEHELQKCNRDRCLKRLRRFIDVTAYAVS